MAISEKDGSETRTVVNYYDDWYLYAVDNGSVIKYGLYKMREQEDDTASGYDYDDPGVTISFVKLDTDKLLTCISSYSLANGYSLLQALDEVTGPGIYKHDDVLATYFADTASKGPYLIAEKYISFIARFTKNGVLDTPKNFKDLYNKIDEVNELLDAVPSGSDSWLVLYDRLQDYERVLEALETINSKAGRKIYNESTYTLNISNVNSLTLYEKQAILACFTADVTFNSFAAEVQYHADAVFNWKKDIPWIGNIWYEAALRADMAIGEEVESGYTDVYYDLNSDIVKSQISIHGKY